jgi:hypothetical protein
LLALRAHEARLAEPGEAGKQAEHRARRADGGDQRDHRPDQQRQGEALDLCRRDREQDESGDRRHDVRVQNRVETLRVTRGNRSADGLARAHLFLDAFEHHHVRVGGNSNREDQSREARQRQRDVEEQQRRVEERRVDAESDDRDEPEEAVEQQEEDRDDDQADDGRLLRLVQRVLAEGRGDVRALRGLEADR